MPRIKIGQLKEGMVIKADIRNRDGTLLLPAGCDLSSKHIRILGSWGISDVNVQSEGALDEALDPLAKFPPEVIAKLEAEFKQRFWQFDETDPVQTEVFRLALRRWIARRPENHTP